MAFGDHGCQFWEHEHLYYVAHLYEESLRVPLIVKIPGVEGGRTSGEPVLHLDVLATVMDLAGAELANPDEVIPLSGRSLLPTMRGESFEPGFYRDRDMILTTHYDMLGVVSDFRHKLIFDRPSGTYLLFDLQEDPREKNNLADDRPEMLEELLLKLKTMAARHKSIVGFVDDGRS